MYLSQNNCNQMSCKRGALSTHVPHPCCPYYPYCPCLFLDLHDRLPSLLGLHDLQQDSPLFLPACPHFSFSSLFSSTSAYVAAPLPPPAPPILMPHISHILVSWLIVASPRVSCCRRLAKSRRRLPRCRPAAFLVVPAPQRQRRWVTKVLTTTGE